MNEFAGWLLDLYPNESGVTLWLLGEDGRRHQFHHPFPTTFYAAGPFPRLRALWTWLRQSAPPARLHRDRRPDLFTGPLDLLAVESIGPTEQQRLFPHVQAAFPDLDYYDADIPLPLRYAAAHNLFPLAHCRLTADPTGRVTAIHPLDDPWEMHPAEPPLRILTLHPDTDPSLQPPTCLHVANGRAAMTIPLDDPTHLLSTVNSLLRRHDPDLVLTRYGDTWLFPLLLDIQRDLGATWFNPNRDPDRAPLRRRAGSYFTYGQVIHRGQQVHLFGRWHIDQANAMMVAEYGLPGVLEQARVTSLPVQEIARRSPGAGITAMQILTALRRGVLVPYQKQQTEYFKSALDLIHADRGGLVYQPLIGLHHDVAEIDFTSMYPSIMARFNISPETVGLALPDEPAAIAPGLNLTIDQSRDGLVPATLRPLLAKRIALKHQLSTLHPLDCRYKPLKARAAALKWLLVVCFGYLGYKNARFGRIEGHEAVTAYGREMLLRAKEAAEDAGYTVLHMYVDGLWIHHPTDSAAGLPALMDEIGRRTGLPIALEGIYRWIAFLPSRMDERVPVANRYFGAFTDGSTKIRGIEARRHDTPPFIAATQLRLLDCLAAADPPADQLPAAVALLRCALDDLHAGRVPPAQLLVSHRLSRELDAYRGRPPGARAAAQLVAAGKPQPAGRRVRFIYTLGEPGVYPWGLPDPLDPTTIDHPRYADLLLRAAANLLQPWLDEPTLRRWAAGGAYQLPLPLSKTPQKRLRANTPLR